MTPNDTYRSLTRRVPIHDSQSVVEYHGPVNSTKLLISYLEIAYRRLNIQLFSNKPLQAAGMSADNVRG